MTKDLKAVCMLVTNIDAPTGGIQKNSNLLLGELNARGINTFVCARNYHGLSFDEMVNGTVFHRSPVIGNSLAVNGLLYLVDTFIWLVKNRKKYDVVHCQQMFGPTMTAVIAGVFTRKPILTRITSGGAIGEANEIRRMPLSRLRVRLIKHVTRFVALTEEMKSELTGLGIPSEKVSVIHNSTEIPSETAFSSADKLKYKNTLDIPDVKIGIFTGRLSEEKCLDSLINAWKQVIEHFPDTLLLLLGEGGAFRNVEDSLRKQVRDLDLESNVVFKGFVPNPKDYLIAADAFILPSRSEGMSNSLVEAFACGSAIIATDIGANREICIHDVNSLLFPVGDSERLAEHLIRVFSEQETAERLGRNARSFAEKELTVQRMADKYMAEYSRMLSDRK